MQNLIKKIKQLFSKSKSNIASTPNKDYIYCYITYDIKNQTASFSIDYDNLLLKDKKNAAAALNNSEQFANLLYSLCNVKDFLPSLIVEELKEHQNDSEAHELFINATMSYLDQILTAKNRLDSIKNHKPIVRPSQVFKHGQ